MGMSYSVPRSSRPSPPKDRTRGIPLDVLVLGLPRTGTASLRHVLRELSYQDPYHFDSLLLNHQDDCSRWVKAFQSKFEGKGYLFTRRGWDDLLYNSQAVSDIPCIVFYRELLVAYPNAKVILTVRSSAKEWAESYKETVRAWFDLLHNKRGPLARLKRFVGYQTPFEKMCALIDRHFLKAIDQNPEKFYEAWIQGIERLVERRRLLVFDVKSGYLPLVQFLQKSRLPIGNVPNKQFPHLNERANFPTYFSVSQNETPQTASRDVQDAQQTEAYDYRGVQSE